MSEQDKVTESATINVKAVSGAKFTKGKNKEYYGVLSSDGATWYNIMKEAMSGVVVGANVLVEYNMLGTSRWSRKTVVLGAGTLAGASKAESEYDASKASQSTPRVEQPNFDTNGLILAANILRISLSTEQTPEVVMAKLKEIYAGISGK